MKCRIDSGPRYNGIRVHTDGAAARAAESVNAHAFCVGHTLYLDRTSSRRREPRAGTSWHTESRTHYNRALSPRPVRCESRRRTRPASAKPKLPPPPQSEAVLSAYLAQRRRTWSRGNQSCCRPHRNQSCCPNSPCRPRRPLRSSCPSTRVSQNLSREESLRMGMRAQR